MRWQNVFLADLSRCRRRDAAARRKEPAGPLITVAREAIAVPDAAHNRIQLSLHRRQLARGGQGSARVLQHDRSRSGDQVLEADRARREARAACSAKWTRLPLFRLARNSRRRRESNCTSGWRCRSACLLLALVGIPLGDLLAQGRQVRGDS